MIRILILAVSAMLFLSVSAGAKQENKAIWQDPETVVVVLDEKAEYKIYRADKIDGEYEYIGESDTGSYRDNDVNYPDTYFYKAEKNGDQTLRTEPIEAKVSPEELTKVTVIMYHNFITDEDILSGVEFDEYSIKPEDLELDLKWLRSNGYTTITSDELLRHLEGEITLPEKAVIISIDDGSWGVYKNAYPIFKKYNMKADFNLIGENIDEVWYNLDSGGTRIGESAPYCTWEEIIEMSNSGVINICSHSYGMHKYNREKRVGMRMMDNEPESEYIQALKADYALSVSCIEGWTGKSPRTVAYPYSKRNDETDRLILENTGYDILMAGENARGTEANYFVKGCDFSDQYMLMSRPCRMEGYPISTYIEGVDKKDAQNGVNTGIDYYKVQNTDEIAKDFSIFDDVSGDAWFAGSVYYSYLNGLMQGVSYKEFAPSDSINRAMAAALLNRLAGNKEADKSLSFIDADGTQWWFASAKWAVENEIITAFDDGSFKPNDTISREALATAMYRCGEYLGLDVTKRADITGFSDYESINKENVDALSWTVASGIFKGNADNTFNPQGNVTRAEMSMVLRNWLSKGEGK